MEETDLGLNPYKTSGPRHPSLPVGTGFSSSPVEIECGLAPPNGCVLLIKIYNPSVSIQEELLVSSLLTTWLRVLYCLRTCCQH